MANPYLKNLNRVEFLLTFACTGECKHCSEGAHSIKGEHIDGKIASDMVRVLATHYNINSLMIFGGEPLLYPSETSKILMAAKEKEIPERQIITNGFFNKEESKIKEIAKILEKSGANNLLLSVDSFHQETIPTKPVMAFAKAILALDLPKFAVHPAWLVNEKAENIYNFKTREILAEFNAIGIPTSKGNVVFPGGNALKYLSDYFDLSIPHVSPYVEDPHNIKSICVMPNGDVLDGNIYDTDILEIIEKYTPKEKV